MSPARIALGLLSAVALMAGCYRADPSLTAAGNGKPEVTATAPESADPGSTVTAEIVVTNPGPGDMKSVVVSFSRIGSPELPEPIVDTGSGGQSPGVVDVTPPPVVVSPDGVVYRFAGLPEGESMEISFELMLPEGSGDVGNAILVYDGDEPERAEGVRLSIAL